MKFAALLLCFFATFALGAVVRDEESSGLYKRASLPTSFKWSSSDVLISPKSDSHNVLAVKDPSIVQYQGVYHVFTSMVTSSGYNLIYLNFTDFSQANNSPQFYLQNSGIGSGYRAAPQIFYFAPQKLWYLIFQDGNAGYSTNANIGNPAGWSPVKDFWGSVPSIITSNIGSGSLVDIWVICDSSNCHLFCSDDNGHLYRAQTSLSSFPNNMGQPVIAMQDTSNKYALFEASNVYNYGSGYLLLVEAIGSDGHRYFRSWTSSSLSGSWTSLANTEANPFARASNVVFKENPGWTQDISHGEMIRSGYDQNLTIDPCNLRYLYQGDAPGSYSNYNNIPWRLALLTQTNSGCSSGGGTTTAPPTTTAAPTTTAPTTTPTSGGGGGGCTQALYGQCGGQGYTGCTTCASGSTCQYSNPWYSQCL